MVSPIHHLAFLHDINQPSSARACSSKVVACSTALPVFVSAAVTSISLLATPVESEAFPTGLHHQGQVHLRACEQPRVIRNDVSLKAVPVECPSSSNVAFTFALSLRF